jgi:MFS family permease
MNTKWTYIACVAIFEGGSALCGGAPNMTAFIIGRCICGLSGTGIYIGVMNILAQMTHEHERALYFGLVAIIWGTGTVLGPIIGGALADADAWRWAFYLNLFVGLVAGPVYFFLIPSNDPRPGASIKERLKPIDYVGTTLMGGALTALFMGMAFGGTMFPWDSARIIALFVVAGVLTILFTLQQVCTVATTEETRIFPIHYLKSKTMVLMAFATAAPCTGSFLIIYFIPLLYQLSRGTSAITAGVQLLPFICFMVTVCVGNGILLGKLPYYKLWFLVSGIFLAVGSGLLFTIDESTANAKIYGYSILYGIGVGASVQLPFSVATVKVKPTEAPLAIGYCTCFQFAGPAVALSIANAVFLDDAVANLRALMPGEDEGRILAALSHVGDVLDGPSSVSRAAIHAAIADAMHSVWLISLSSGCLIVILACFMKFERLFGVPPGVGAA